MITMQLAQEQWAARLGTTPSALASWELGKSVPNLMMLGKMTLDAGVDHDYLQHGKFSTVLGNQQNTFDVYSKTAALVKEDQDDMPVLKSGQLLLLKMALGLDSRSGEVLELIREHLYEGKEMDLTELQSLIGDCLWHICSLAEVCGPSLQDIAEANVITVLKRRATQKSNQQTNL